MREQHLPDQGAIGPSAQDIAFFKNQNRPPLRNFPGRQALAPVAIVGTSVLVSGCVRITDAPPNPDRTPTGTDMPELRPKGVFDEQNTGTGEGEVLVAGTERINIFLPFPEGETWALTGGIHNVGSLDWAPWKPIECPDNNYYPTTFLDYWATASISGKIKEIRGPQDGDPGVLIIEADKGVQVVYRHVLQTDDQNLKVGKKVKAGELLIHPACVGDTTGLHIDTSVKINGETIPGEQIVYSGWQSRRGDTEYNGTLEKDGEEVRTANIYRCAPPDNATNPNCDGTRNDITNGNSRPEQPTDRQEPRPIEFPDFEGSPLEEAKYAFITRVFNFMNNSTMVGNEKLTQWIDYPAEKLIEVAQALARGEEITLDDPIAVYWISIFYSGYKEAGIGYLNTLKITIEQDSLSNADAANGLRWSGTPYLSAIVKVGVMQSPGDGTKGFDFSRIQNFSGWMDVDTAAYTQLRSGSAFVNLSCDDWDVRSQYPGKACLGGPKFVDVFWIPNY